MTELAELRMHLRDEHARYGSVKEGLDRNITSHGERNVPLDTRDEEGDYSEQLQNQISSTGSFASVVDGLAQAAEEAERDSIDLSTLESADDDATIPLKIPLSELFDFDNPYWTDLWRRIAARNLDDEMEFHELLDMDADGDVYDGAEADVVQSIM